MAKVIKKWQYYVAYSQGKDLIQFFMSKVSKAQRKKKLDTQQQLNLCVLLYTGCMLLHVPLDYKASQGNTVKGKNDSRDFRSFASAQILLIFGMWLAFK